VRRVFQGLDLECGAVAGRCLARGVDTKEGLNSLGANSSSFHPSRSIIHQSVSIILDISKWTSMGSFYAFHQSNSFESIISCIEQMLVSKLMQLQTSSTMKRGMPTLCYSLRYARQRVPVIWEHLSLLYESYNPGTTREKRCAQNC
jgi:hypothetical protein